MYTLLRQPSVPVEHQNQIAWGVVLTVKSSNPVAFPPEAFVMQAVNLHDPAEGAWFTAVATPDQLEQYPTDPAEIENTTLQLPYFRVSTITLVSGNPDDIDILVRRIAEDLALLQANLIALTKFEQPEEILIP
jgi:hypothetical protein